MLERLATPRENLDNEKVVALKRSTWPLGGIVGCPNSLWMAKKMTWGYVEVLSNCIKRKWRAKDIALSRSVRVHM